MAHTSLLDRFSRHFVYQRFDPHNQDHLKAYAYWRLHGRQHPTLRFQLEDPFTNVPAMMEAKIAKAWLEHHEATDVQQLRYMAVQPAT